MASKRPAFLVLVSAPLLAHCMPDFDALSAGLDSSAGTSSGGDATAGVGAAGSSSSNGGTSSKAGSPSGGMPSGAAAGTAPSSGNAGAAGEAPEGGADGGAGDGGTGLGGAGDGGAGDGGAGLGGAPGGQGGAPGCESPATGVTPHNTFDAGVSGPGGFVGVSADANMHTTLGATGSSNWDPVAGSSCPGALHFTFNFEGYASGSAADEKGYANYVFSSMDWSDFAALHLMVKVSPANAPIASLQLFVLSGSQYLFWGKFDDGGFKSGEWREMILQPVPGPYYDPTNVRRIGVELVLARAGTQGIPATAPTVDVWFDDMWLEAK